MGKKHFYIFFIALLLYIGWGYFVYSAGIRIGSGDFGDSFGFFAAIAASMTAVFSLWSISVQLEELRLTRSDITSQKKENEKERDLLLITVRISYLFNARDSYEISRDIIRGIKGAGKIESEQSNNRKQYVEEYMKQSLSWIHHTNYIARTITEFQPETIAHRDTSARFNIADVHFPLWVIQLSSALMALFVIVWFFVVNTNEGHTFGTGLFGDAFGPITSFATTFSIVLNVYSILIHKKEIGETRSIIKDQSTVISMQNLSRIVDMRIRLQNFIELINNDMINLSLANKDKLFNNDEMKNLFFSVMEALNKAKEYNVAQINRLENIIADTTR